MRALSLLLLLSFSTLASAAPNHANKWFFMWGYNHTSYKNSDINFKGPGYDFTLYDVQAKDRPSEFSWSYVAPDITIPQTNTRIGYYLDETHRIHFGVDHMKYVMVTNQIVNKTGTDHVTANTLHGITSSNPQLLSPDYLTYEHTDGLNYVTLGYEMLYPFWENNWFRVSAIHGPDAGFVYPKTNVTMAGQNTHDNFSVAGYGASYKVGLITDIGKDWFVQLEFKRGLLNMPWIRTTSSSEDSASQKIDFTEGIMTVGYVF